MSVPILTIPESAFDPSKYVAIRTQNNLVKYLLRLVRVSSVFLVLAYLVGTFGVRPLLETTILQRLDFLENCRGKLRDLYLNVIGRVNYIPIVAIHKKDGSGKLCADAVCQTEDSVLGEAEDSTDSALGMNSVLCGLSQLSESLSKCTGFKTSHLPHFRVVDYCLKDFRQKTDMLYFNQRTLFSGPTHGLESKKDAKNTSQEVKTEIRTIKGLYMSGMA